MALTGSEKTKLWRQRHPGARRKFDKAYEQRRKEKLKSNPLEESLYKKQKAKWDKAYRERRKEKGFKRKQKPYSQLTDEQRKKKVATAKAWRERHKEQVKQIHAKNKDNRMFGGNREKVIQRDNEKCQACGMTRQEHLEKFKRDISVDHKDRMGRGVSFENKIMICLT